MKKLNQSQRLMLFIATILLFLDSVYSLINLIHTVINYSQYLFTDNIYFSVMNFFWILTTPLYLVLAIGMLVALVTKRDGLLGKISIAQLVFHFFIIVLNFVCTALLNGMYFNWIPNFFANYLFGWLGVLSHLFTILGNLGLLLLAISMILNLTSNKPQRFAPVPQMSAPVQLPMVTPTENPTKDLAELVKMYEAGHLTATEFKAAKKKLLE